MGRFDWEEGELKIGNSQCDFCIFKNIQNQRQCKKYEEKPEVVLKDEIRCEHLAYEENKVDENSWRH